MPILQVPPAFDAAAAVAFGEAVARLSAEATRDVLVLRGADGVFCRGVDLAAASAASDEAVAHAVAAYAGLLHHIRASALPTLALVDGEARGGGLGLMAACDVVVATDRSRFALPELLLGMLPAVIYPVLRSRLSVHQVRLWALTADARTAEEGHRARLVDEVVSPADLDAVGRRWQRRLSRVPPAAVKGLRRLTADDRLGDEGVAHGVALTTAALQDPAARESLRRFVEEGALPWETA